MADMLIRNVGTVVTGELDDPLADVESLYIADGIIEELDATTTTAETEIDARGTTVIPGLIDGHVHPVSGQFTPRQNTLGWCNSYLHGGTTSMISAGEIHYPGRPSDAVGARALAVLNAKAYDDYRPGGVKMHAGTLILNDGMTVSDVDAAREAGVERTKIIFAMEDRDRARDLVARAKSLGMTTMIHAGGSSVPGTEPIGEAMIRHVEPDVALHFNGGPTAMPDDELTAIVDETAIDLELVIAGNQRTAVEILQRVDERHELGRLQLGTDTPTGTGVVSCGMWLEASILAGLTDVPAATIICLATGNVARRHGLDEGLVREGRPADLCLLDAPLGSEADDALGAIEHGDYPSVDKVLVDGELLVDGSRNTGPPKRPAHVE